MKRIAARDFEERTTEYLDAREALGIEWDGVVIGDYVPVANGAGDRSPTNGPIELRRPTATVEERRQAIEQFDRTIERVLAESGVTTEELADLLGLTRPFPYHD